MSRISVVDESQSCVAKVIASGDFVIDATVGNGSDTEFLCHRVGPGGLVMGIDSQSSSVESTRKRLKIGGLLDRSVLLRADHGLLDELARVHAPGRTAAAVMFNLGYLPGGDKSVITRPTSTVRGLTSALSLLQAGGILSIVVYRGHPGAPDEARAVEEWLDGLSGSDVDIAWKGRDGVPTHRPYVVCVRKSR